MPIYRHILSSMIAAPKLDVLGKVLSEKQVHRFSRPETISSSDDFHDFWYIKSGYVKRFEIMNDGSICVQMLFGPGDGFSLIYLYQLLFDKKVYTGPETYYYEAMSDVEAWQFTDRELLELCKSTPELYHDILAIAGNHFLGNIQMLENKGLHDAKLKVAHEILFLAKRFGQHTAQGIKIMIPLTQQDIADIVSLTRESVSTAIQKLRHEGLLTNGRSLIVTDMQRLHEAAFQA